ncbi:uncharacterized protein LOC110984445 [Acanthaster planci]|uniref:nicotinamidase n=1 Tax=Acanthaster planci TaxID=133434 RepID=A0A8B7ZAS5_ACAPL|nr:uncharacterized protein LOC110984445 [Acanthaster planci]XP_022100346.1 uncharacterized protein LOC110984445 [Acanthaster planci]XP_022100347.1 uncharacterized protein LOC110984445 [Acanthaster planci]
MAQWSGFGGGNYHLQDTEQMNACFAHYDSDRDGVLNEDEFHNLCCDLFTIDGRRHVVSKTDSVAMMKVLCGDKDGRGIATKDFAFCWKYWLNQILSPRAAIFVVDVQNDFIDGSLALRLCSACQDGLEVVPVINELLDLTFEVVVYTKDYHPPNHLSFFDNLSQRKLHPSSKAKANEAKLLDVVVFDSQPSVEQILWPVHCVEGTKGAELHPDLKIVENHLVHLKGTDPDIESYSVFKDQTQRVNTALIADLKARDITDIFVCGLASDFCVGMTAMDAQRLGYRTMVIEDASRGANLDKIEEMKQGLLRAGCVIGLASEVPAMLSGRTRLPQLGLVAAHNAAQARTAQPAGHPGLVKVDAKQKKNMAANVCPATLENNNISSF